MLEALDRRRGDLPRNDAITQAVLHWCAVGHAGNFGSAARKDEQPLAVADAADQGLDWRAVPAMAAEIRTQGQQPLAVAPAALHSPQAAVVDALPAIGVTHTPPEGQAAAYPDLLNRSVAQMGQEMHQQRDQQLRDYLSARDVDVDDPEQVSAYIRANRLTLIDDPIEITAGTATGAISAAQTTRIASSPPKQDWETELMAPFPDEPDKPDPQEQYHLDQHAARQAEAAAHAIGDDYTWHTDPPGDADYIPDINGAPAVWWCSIGNGDTQVVLTGDRTGAIAFPPPPKKPVTQGMPGDLLTAIAGSLHRMPNPARVSTLRRSSLPRIEPPADAEGDEEQIIISSLGGRVIIDDTHRHTRHGDPIRTSYWKGRATKVYRCICGQEITA